MTLTFNEPVSASLGGVRVLDSTGLRVDTGVARVDGAAVSIALKVDLPAGTYVVSYRVLSEDGHPARGGSVFGVGRGAVDTAALGRVTDTAADHRWEIVGGVGRGLAYAGTLLAAGGVLFLLLVHRDGRERRHLVRLVRMSALLGALAGLVALPVQAALGTGDGPASLFESGVLSEVAAEGVGLALLLALVGLAMSAFAVERVRLLAGAGAVVAAASFAATGHSRSGSPVLATVADAVHLVAVAIWAGGLVLLWKTVRSRRADPTTDPRATALLVTRFSTLATASIVAVGASGLLLAWNEVRSIHNVAGTNYGKALLVKLAFVAVMALAGAYNHLRLVPALEQGKVTAAMAHLRHTLRIEVVAVIAVVATTAILVQVTPARTAVAGGPVEKIVQLGDLGKVQLVISPARAGFNQVHLYLYDPQGRPSDLADTLTLELSLPSAQLGPLTREATRAGPAHLQLVGDDFAVAGRWHITVHLRSDRFTEVTGTTDIQIAP